MKSRGKMELIKTLNTRRCGKRKKRYGVFFCPACQKNAEKPMNEGTLNKTCGCLRHGDHGSNLHNIWCSIKRRCNLKTNDSYKWYGGRGITVCDEWENYNPFKKWAVANGFAEGLQIDRIDNEKGYFAENCQFTSCAKNIRKKNKTKLSWPYVNILRALRKSGQISDKRLSEIFNISPKYVINVAQFKTWKP
jgi:hypothetical protein